MKGLFRTLTAGLVVTVVGCGSSEKPVNVEQRLFGNTTADQKAQIQSILDKNNIKGTIVSVEVSGDIATVDVSAAGTKGKVRGMMMPESHAVDLKKGELIKSQGQKRRGGALD